MRTKPGQHCNALYNFMQLRLISGIELRPGLKYVRRRCRTDGNIGPLSNPDGLSVIGEEHESAMLRDGQCLRFAIIDFGGEVHIVLNLLFCFGARLKQQPKLSQRMHVERNH